MLTPVALPTPAALEELGQDLEWCVDVWVPGHQPPARTGIPSSALHQYPAGSLPEAIVRVSRSGLSFSSANVGYVPAGVPLEGRLAHPLRLPSAEQIFDQLAAKHGATVQRSSAGRRAANAVDLWGSFTAITADLTGDVRRLLDAFLPAPRGPGTTAAAMRSAAMATSPSGTPPRPWESMTTRRVTCLIAYWRSKCCGAVCC